nr:hypothetical protein [uncultured Bacteroides sp.]
MKRLVLRRGNKSFIAHKTNETTVTWTVDILITTMEEYANFGFDFIEDKMMDNQEFFFKNSAFLDIFLSFTAEKNEVTEDEDAESLD